MTLLRVVGVTTENDRCHYREWWVTLLGVVGVITTEGDG